jgi:hypothetical protein
MISATRRKHPQSYQQPPVDILVSIALQNSRTKLVLDRSWQREHRQEKIGLGVEAAIGDTSSPV